jgi:drug/metabolite transporter (DMT)-like permease
VVLVPVFLALFWRRKISVWSACGVALAFTGLYLLTIPGGSGLKFRSVNHGDVFTLIAAVVFAFHIILMGHATQLHNWKQIVVMQTGVAAILMILAVPAGEKIWVIWSARVIAGILLTGFFSLALAFAIQAWAQQFTPATHAALIFSLEPVFASITSFLFLGERLGLRAVIGGLLILAGVLISEEKGTTESLAVAPDHAAVPPTNPQPALTGKALQNQ